LDKSRFIRVSSVNTDQGKSREEPRTAASPQHDEWDGIHVGAVAWTTYKGRKESS
jgi:hypothetical protein